MALTDEERVEVMRKAIALYFDCDVETVGNFVFGVERTVEHEGEERAMFSGGWSLISHWYLFGMIDELRVMLDRNSRQQPQPAMPEMEVVDSDKLDELLRSAGDGKAQIQT